MTESQFTAKFKKDLHTLTGAVIIKHCDLYTGGIPDLSATWNGCTSWIEVKVDDYEATALQRWFLMGLRSSMMVTWDTRAKRATVAMRGDESRIATGLDYRHLLEFVAQYVTRNGEKACGTAGQR